MAVTSSSVQIFYTSERQCMHICQCSLVLRCINNRAVCYSAHPHNNPGMFKPGCVWGSRIQQDSNQDDRMLMESSFHINIATKYLASSGGQKDSLCFIGERFAGLKTDICYTISMTSAFSRHVLILVRF